MKHLKVNLENKEKEKTIKVLEKKKSSRHGVEYRLYLT